MCEVTGAPTTQFKPHLVTVHRPRRSAATPVLSAVQPTVMCWANQSWAIHMCLG
jgi:hypothetical protein